MLKGSGRLAIPLAEYWLILRTLRDERHSECFDEPRLCRQSAWREALFFQPVRLMFWSYRSICCLSSATPTSMPARYLRSQPGGATGAPGWLNLHRRFRSGLDRPAGRQHLQFRGHLHRDRSGAGLLEEDYGRIIALQFYRYPVLYLKRSGSQVQFGSYLRVQFSHLSGAAPDTGMVPPKPGRLSLGRGSGGESLNERTQFCLRV